MQALQGGNVPECTPCQGEKFVYPEGSREQQWQGSDITRIVLLKYLLGCDVEVGLMKSLQEIISSHPAKHNKYQSYSYDRGMANGNTFKR